ncbi:DUF1173 family protein [Methylobacter sp. BlB1]|uniref:DUF1173 family protein n=1 Tax=Methylobacter sp. BlB1 TaxID=2785914 RepID=UPI0018948CA7|nr:DUF1173 family protein [Methylobacter sp. BlB1]MBF6649762.1 DUF1173 family protein [Methylobacter sp. BlB1]
MSRIIINNRHYDLGWLSDPENDSAQNLLRKHYQNPIRPVCGCLSMPDGRNRELSIRKCRRFLLARLPKTGENHSILCPFYGTSESRATANGGAQPAIIERNGIVNINLASYLRVAMDLKGAGGGGHAPAGATRPTITLLGLLNESLHQTRLNIWYPNRQRKRSLTTLHNCILDMAQDMVIEGERRRLADMLVIPHWLQDKPGSLRGNRATLFVKTTKPERAAIIIGHVTRWIPSRRETGGIGVGLDLLDELLWMTPETAAAAERSFGQLISEIDKRDRHILAICTVFRTGKYCTIADLALLRTNLQFIPVESAYELQIADKLVAEGRAFRKPLRVDGSGFRPDFVLTDGDKDWALEVFGMTRDPAYQARKERKLKIYHQQRIPLWSWTPEDDDAVPDFPERETKPAG